MCKITYCTVGTGRACIVCWGVNETNSFEVFEVFTQETPLFYQPLTITRSLASTRIIKPVWDFLKNKGQGGRTFVSWLSAGQIFNNGSLVVACTADEKNSEAQPRSVGKSETQPRSVGSAPLANVMDFTPLRLAFGEFCRKALCSEVRRCSTALGV